MIQSFKYLSTVYRLIVAFQFTPKGCSANAQFLRRYFFIVPALFQHFEYVIFSHTIDSFRTLQVVTGVFIQGVDNQFLVDLQIAGHAQSFDGVLKFPDIAEPGIVLQSGHGFPGYGKAFA